MDESRAVYGYELFDRSTASDSHTAASSTALLFVPCPMRAPGMVGKKTVLPSCTHDSLSGGHLELIHPDKVVLEVPLADGATQEDIEGRLPTLEALRTRGFRLAFDQQASSAPTPAGCPWRHLPQAGHAGLSPSWQPLVKFATTHSKATLVAESRNGGAIRADA